MIHHISKRIIYLSVDIILIYLSVNANRRGEGFFTLRGLIGRNTVLVFSFKELILELILPFVQRIQAKYVIFSASAVVCAQNLSWFLLFPFKVVTART